MSHDKLYPDYRESGVEWIGQVPKDGGGEAHQAGLFNLILHIVFSFCMLHS